MPTLTNEEWDALGDPERGGSLAKQKAHLAAEEKIVFGHDIEKKKGHPVEKGVGSAGRENGNHFNGIRKYEGEEAYQGALEEIWRRDPDHAKKLGLQKPRSKAA